MLAAHNLTKTFKRGLWRRDAPLKAVDDLSFSVDKGDIFGFLGPNGAGKSTTIRMLLGLIHPSAGSVEIGGCNVLLDRQQALRKVGAFVEAPSFYPFLSGRKNLEIFSSLSGGVSSVDLDRVIELVGLKGRDNDIVKVYSHGMRQRLGLAACLLPKPELLILDEPTDGLDPHGIRATRELIIRLARDEKITIFLSSHLLSEVENLCNRIVILDRGKVILHGLLSDLEREHRRLEIRVASPELAAELLRTRFNLNAQMGGNSLMIVNCVADVGAIAGALLESKNDISAILPENAWLDRLFLELTTPKV